MLKVCSMLSLSLVNRGKSTSVSYQRWLEPLSKDEEAMEIDSVFNVCKSNKVSS